MRRIQTDQIQPFEKEHVEKMRRLAPECMVLLKNDGTLPLDTSSKIALFGSGARHTVKGGTGSGDVNVRHFITVEEGIKNAGAEIVTGGWLDAYDEILVREKKAFYGGIRKAADEAGVELLFMLMGRACPEPEYELSIEPESETDTAVYVLARDSGEGADRRIEKGDIRLTETEIRDILACSRRYRKFVLVLNTGGMVDLSPVSEVGCILQMGQLGTCSGDALADVIFGKAYPSGKLTMSWCPIEKYPGTEGFGDPDDTFYREGVYVGYRYFNTAGISADFGFGYGLGYTTFSVDVQDVSADGSRVTVKVSVKNTGAHKGKEVVQVYYSAPCGKLDKPAQELAAFRKTGELLSGEEETLELCFDTADMASFDEEAEAWILEAGEYMIRVGTSAAENSVAAVISLDEDAVTEKVKHICGEPGFADWKPEGRNKNENPADEIPEGVPVIRIKGADIPGKICAYRAEPEEAVSCGRFRYEDVASGKCTPEQFVAGLTDEELTWLCIGNYKEADNMVEVIGNAASLVAGAAGETTGYLKNLGVPSVVMADGPAGIRLSRQYTLEGETAKGKTSLEQSDIIYALTPEEIEAMSAAAESAPKDETVYYQNCTAIPIGTALAQSWSEEVMEICGDIVGKEMELFGIQIWLAPALNIQRSPLCGRNFEYYSEDPLVSGLAAAAVTRGVQKHPGCVTTIKHFACNNQETNRYFSNSHVSERALREIYLKGFEICVKNAMPGCIMTSYNLINGEHACNSQDLLTSVLRDEWGYEGVVMTDWLVTGGMGKKGNIYPCASAAGDVKAGNDLTMPGLRSDKADILDALNNESHPYCLTRADLQTCALRVMKLFGLLNDASGVQTGE